MKNLTRILALVLVFTMMISTAAFAGTFSDVAEDSTYAEATTVLSALGILNGYEDGTFKPEAVITRAEVVAVANRLQGLSDAAKAAANATKYTDVPSTAWYAGDVNLATQMGIVSGDGNGLFRPDDQVKYEEAVKMMVAALGYHQEYVLKQGGWPTGYLVIATEKGVTKGLSVNAGEPAYRGIVAKLAYQSLTAPMMVLSTYDDEGKATYKADATKTLLGTKLGFAKVSGYVVNNEVSSLEGSANTDKGYVDFRFDGSKYVESTTTSQNGLKYYVGNRDVADFGYKVENGDPNYAKATIKNVDVNGFDLASTLGYATDIYLSTNDKDEPMVLTYVDATKKNALATIEDPTMVQKTTATNGKETKFETEGVYLSVYDEENETVEEEYVIENGAGIIYNGKFLRTINPAAVNNTSESNIGPVLAPKNGKIELLDNDADGKYDYIFVTAYETMVVQEVFAKNTKIGMLAGTTLELENHIDGKDGYAYSITLDGKEIEISDLQEYDVLSVAYDIPKDPKKSNNIEIIVSRNVVEGEIDAYEGTGEKRIYTIAGNEYKIASLAPSTAKELQKLKTSSEGKFYIDYFGNLAYFEGSTGIRGNVAYIQGGADTQGTRGAGYELELLNKDGSVQVLSLASEIKIDNKDTATPVATFISTYKTAIEKANKDKSLAEKTAMMITYKVNSANKISAINFLKNDPSLNNDSATNDEYAADVSSLKHGVTEDTVVFFSPAKDADENKVTTGKFFIDEAKYNVAFFDIDDSDVASLVLVTYTDVDTDAKEGLALVTKVVTTTNDNDEDVQKVTFLQNGEEKTLKTAADFTAHKFAVGDIFEYSVNADDEIDGAKIAYALYDTADANKANLNGKVLSLAKIYDIALGKVKYNHPTDVEDDDNNPITPDVPVKVTFAFDTKKNNTNANVSYIGGYVVAKSGSTLTLVNKLVAIDQKVGDGADFEIDTTNASKVNVGTSANFYTVDYSKTKKIPAVAALGDVISVKIAAEDAKLEEGQDTFVLIKYVDRTVVDVIAFNGFAPSVAKTLN